MSRPRYHAAIDLGASNGRLVLGRLEGGRLAVQEAGRVANSPVLLPDGLHWDVIGLYRQLVEALARAGREAGAPPATVAVDGWAVDYGLLDAGGRLLGLPFHYRDRRTSGRVEEAELALGAGTIFSETGIQLMPINTLFQLLAERGSAAYASCSQLLLIPDLIGFFLTGVARTEWTNASTTQLFDVRTARPASRLLAALGLRDDVFAPLVEPGGVLGPVLPDVASAFGLDRATSVVSVASHDTASAVLAVPAQGDDFAYVASGTWSLVGAELERPLVNETTMRLNFSNEAGADGTTTFLKNVMGHFIVQECERQWARQGVSACRLAGLESEAARAAPFLSVVDADDPVFAEPGDMPARIRAACRANAEPEPDGAGAVVRCVLESIALRTAVVVGELEACLGRELRVVHLVGGGSGSPLFAGLLAAACGRRVRTGPVEASAVGNLLVQLRAGGLEADRAELRALVARSFPIIDVEPDPSLARLASLARRRLEGARSLRKEQPPQSS